MNLYIGQTLSFQIKSNNGSQIEIKPLLDNLTENPSLLKALDIAGLPVNEKNMKMVKYLMDSQMPIDKQTLQEIHKQGTLYAEADIKSIVQMNKLQIPITKENIVQFENYKNYEHRIAKGIEDIAGEIPKLLETLSKEGDYGKAVLLQKEVLSIISGDSNPEVSSKNPAMSSVETNSVGNQTVSSAEINSLGSQEILGKHTKAAGGTSELENRKETNGIGRTMSLEERGTLIQKLQSFPLPESVLEDIKNGMISETDLLENIKLSLETKGTFGAEDLKNLFGSKEYQKVLKEFVKKTWLLTPEKLVEKDSMKEYYKNLDDQVTKLNQLANQINQEAASLTKFTTNLKENMDFMNQLNQMYTYLQIPLKLKNQTVHSELYVYTNKKNLAKKDGNISVLLHLDMEALGSVDVYINLDKRNLNTKFYLDNTESMRIIEENIETLERKLTEKGYICSTTVNKREENINHIEEFLEIHDNEGTMKRYTFDVRT